MENSTEQSQKSKEVFLTMVGLLGLNSEVKDKVSGRNIILSVSTDEPGRLIGRNGSSLDSVGLLMNRILKKTDNTFPKVIIDVDGYDKKPKRERRKNSRKDNRKDNRKQKHDKMEKTAVMTEAPADDQINVYVDHETDKVAPVTTVALNHSDSNDYSGKPQRRERRDNKRGNRRDNKRNDRRRDDRKERAPQAKKETVPASASEPSLKPEKPVAEQSSAPAPAADKGGKPVNKLQMQCRNAAKEVKRWGEDILLPPLSEADCQKAIDHFNAEKGVSAQIDNSRSYGDKKRVRISLKK